MTPQKLLDRFLLGREAGGLSARSHQWYKEQIGSYLAHLASYPSLPVFSPESIEHFLAHERRRGLSMSTVQARYRALRAFFNWCEDCDEPDMPRSPLGYGRRKRVPMPKVEQKRINYVKPAEFRRVLAAIDLATWKDHRDYAMMQVLFWCGLRRSECAGLWVKDVDFEDELVHVRAGKGAKDRDVPLAHEVQAAIQAYLSARPVWPGPELWLGEDTKTHQGVAGPLSSNGLRLMLERRSRQAGLRRLNAHAWRHGFAMTMLNAGVDMSAVSAMMGHSSIAVTERLYARWLTEGLKREYGEAAQRIRW